MPLVASAIKDLMFAGIKTKLLAKFPATASSPEMVKQQEDMADAIADGVTSTLIPYLISNTQVLVNPGIAVATAGGPAAQVGATTSPGTGTIS